MATAQATSKRVIRVLSALYFSPTVDPFTGNEIRQVLEASRGQEVELVASEEERLDSLYALLPKGSNPEDAAIEQAAHLDLYRGQRGDMEAMGRALNRAGGSVVSHDPSAGIIDLADPLQQAEVPEKTSSTDLADQITQEKMNADDTVALAGDDPAKAKRVLEAERLASGGSPRAGVEAKLQKIIEG